MSRIRTSLALGMICLLLVSTSISAVESGESYGDLKESVLIGQPCKEDDQWTEKAEEDFLADIDDWERDPININNNSDFADQAEDNNWPGNGSEDNPYIIEGYEIDGGDHGYGIYVGNVTDHFVVRDCTLTNSTLENDGYFRNSGIYIYNTSNGHIQGNTVTNNSIGIVLTDSPNNMVVVNDIIGNTEGMNITHSSNNVLGDNLVYENEQTGISLTSSHSNEITMNNVSFNQGVGVFLEGGDENSISDHRSIGNAQAGLIFLQSNDNEVLTSTIKNNGDGIIMTSSDENVVKNIRITENENFGFRLDSSNSNLVEDNNISLNGGNALHLISSDLNVVNYTEILSNGNYGIHLDNSEYNMIYHNNLIDNDIQAYDNGINNEWTNGYPEGGNYWSDHEGPDEYYGEDQNSPGSDGIIDDPYQEIEGGSGAQDDYPLVKDVPTPHIRIESPEEGANLSSSNVTVEWTPMYRFTDTLIFEGRIDQEEWEYVGQSTHYTFTKVDVGEHTVEIEVRDQKGNKNNDTIDFEVYYEVADIEISPDSATTRAGNSIVYDAIGYDDVGGEIGFVPAEWTIEEGAGGSWEDDVYTSEIAGNWTIIGSYGDIEENGILNVRPGFADGFEFDIIDDQVAGDSFEIHITALDEFGNIPENYTGEAELSDDTGTIEPNQTENFTYSIWSGEVSITQARDNITISAVDGRIFGQSNTFDVGPAVLNEVIIHPDEKQNITAGEQLNFSAAAYDTLENLITDEPTDFNWENTTEEGIFNKTEEGEYMVQAEYEGLSSNITVEVVPAEAASVYIEPGEDQTITAGEELEFSAFAYDEFDNLITGDAKDFIWTAEGGFIDEGHFYDTRTGEYSVTAIFYDEREVKSEPTTVTVEADDIDQVIVDPARDRSVKAGEIIEFSAEGYDAFGNLITEDDTDFTWENTDDRGLFQEGVAGAYEVKVSYQGVSESLTVTVKPGPVENIEIGPEEDLTLTAGEKIQFSAEAYDEFGNLITGDAEDFDWENTDEKGLFDNTEAGTYDVFVFYDDTVSKSISVTVEPAEVVFIDLEPGDDKTITSPDTIQFSAQAYDEYGNLITSETEDFNWENTTGSGLFNKTEEGEYRVRASFDGLKSSTVRVEVEWKMYTIEFGPILDVNGDPVNDASVHLSWERGETSLQEASEGIYEFDIKLPRPPDDIEFTARIEHEDILEPESITFDGNQHGEMLIEDIGEKPGEPAGVGPAVIVILLLFVIIIILAAWFSLKKSGEVEPFQELDRTDFEREKEEEDILDQIDREIEEEKKLEGSNEKSG